MAESEIDAGARYLLFLKVLGHLNVLEVDCEGNVRHGKVVDVRSCDVVWDNIFLSCGGGI